jgi:hypothetical protein
MFREDAPATDQAWDELFDALPRGWMVGRPQTDSNAPVHRLYAFKRRPRQRDERELIVQAPSEEEAVRALARQLRRRKSTGRNRR